MQTGDGLIERTLCLHHVVVRTSVVGIQRDAEADFRMLKLGKSSCIFGPGECPPIREHVQFSFRHRYFQLRNQSEKMVAEKRGFSAGDGEVRRMRFNQTNQFEISFGERLNVVLILRWLRTHEAIAVAALGDEEVMV